MSKVGLAALVDAVRVVQRGRSVDADPDEELVLGEQLAPLVGEQRAVGLDGVLHGLVGPAVLLDEGQGAAEEVDAHQRRLAALPRDRDLRAGLRLEQLADVGVEHLVGHAEPVARIQRLLRQEEAVLAVEVADRARRLGQHVEDRRRRQRTVRGEGGPRPGAPVLPAQRDRSYRHSGPDDAIPAGGPHHPVGVSGPVRFGQRCAQSVGSERILTAP